MRSRIYTDFVFSVRLFGRRRYFGFAHGRSDGLRGWKGSYATDKRGRKAR